MRMPLRIMPPEITEQYNLKELEADGWVYIKLSRASIRSACLHTRLEILQMIYCKRDYIKEHGDHQCQYTLGLYKHVWRPVTFTLAVDDFCVKFIGDQHANHLKNTLEKYYI